MSEPIAFEAVAPVTALLRGLGIEHYIAGSVASVLHGVPRSTVDVDIVARIRTEHARIIAQELGEAFYVDEAMIRDAARQGGSFNVIHLATMYKVDVFIAGSRPFDHSALERIVYRRATGEDVPAYPIASAEDTILSKLEWYRRGGETSERQWEDVIGVMKVQGEQLDEAYLDRWAAELGVSDLIERARREARM